MKESQRRWGEDGGGGAVDTVTSVPGVKSPSPRSGSSLAQVHQQRAGTRMPVSLTAPTFRENSTRTMLISLCSWLNVIDKSRSKRRGSDIMKKLFSSSPMYSLSTID